MSYKYFCDKCNYGSENKYNYKAHLRTSKHINLVKSTSITDLDELSEDGTYHPGGSTYHPGGRQEINVIEQPQKYNKLISKKASKTITCEYCKKTISHVNHKNRHYSTCQDKMRIDHVYLLQRLKLAEQRAEEAIQIKEKLEQDNREQRVQIKTIQDMAKNMGNTSITNNIDKRHMNVYYIVNNYTDVENYEDVMSKKLSRAERDHVKNFGPSAGCERIIMNRCVTGIPKEKRPIHCVDAAREKFIYRTDGVWEIDYNGENIMKPVMAQVRTQFDISDKNTDIDDRVNNLRLLLDMDMYARKRTVKNLKKDTLLKN